MHHAEKVSNAFHASAGASDAALHAPNPNTPPPHRDPIHRPPVLPRSRAELAALGQRDPDAHAALFDPNTYPDGKVPPAFLQLSQMSQMSRNVPICPTSNLNFTTPRNPGCTSGAPHPPDDAETPAPNAAKPLPPLKPRQAIALQLLLAGQSDSTVAAHLDLSRRTIHRWRHTPAFAAHLARAAESLHARGAARLANLCAPALDQLADALRNSDGEYAYRSARDILRISRISDHLSTGLDAH